MKKKLYNLIHNAFDMNDSSDEPVFAADWRVFSDGILVQIEGSEYLIKVTKPQFRSNVEWLADERS